MIIILKEGVSANAVDNILGKIKDAGLNTHMSVGASKHIIGVIGDTTKINVGQLMTQEGVEDIRRVSEPFKTVNRKFTRTTLISPSATALSAKVSSR